MDNGIEEKQEGMRQGNGSPLILIRGRDLYDRLYPPRPCLIEGVIKRGDLALLVGKPKSGKSWLMLQMARAIDLGEAWLGRETLKGKVLFLALEDGEHRVHERMRAMNWRPEQAEFAFHISPLHKSGMAQIRHIAEEFDVIFVDTFRAACGRADENNNAEMGSLVQSLANIAHGSGTTIIFSHHVRKTTGDDPFDTIRGAVAIRAAYDVGLILERRKGSATAVLRVESRDLTSGDFTLSFSEERQWEPLVSANQDNARLTVLPPGLATLLREMGKVTTEEAARAMGMTAVAVRRHLIKAEEVGVVVREFSAPNGKKPHILWRLRE